MNQNYWQVRLGRGGMWSDSAYKEGYIGIGFDIEEPLSPHTETCKWEEFRNTNKPKFTHLGVQQLGNVYRFTLIKKGDIVISPTKEGDYLLGEVIGDYSFTKEDQMHHRKTVRWNSKKIKKDQIDPSLQSSLSSLHTIISLNRQALQLVLLLGGQVSAENLDIKEKILQEVLVQNWDKLDLPSWLKEYEITEEGMEYVLPSQNRIDILAQHKKDKNKFCILELKRTAKHSAVSQLMVYDQELKEEKGESIEVEGVIIALEKGKNLDTALRSINKDTERFHFYKCKLDLNILEE